MEYLGCAPATKAGESLQNHKGELAELQATSASLLELVDDVESRIKKLGIKLDELESVKSPLSRLESLLEEDSQVMQNGSEEQQLETLKQAAEELIASHPSKKSDVSHSQLGEQLDQEPKQDPDPEADEGRPSPH